MFYRCLNHKTIMLEAVLAASQKIDLTTIPTHCMVYHSTELTVIMLSCNILMCLICSGNYNTGLRSKS